MGISVLNFGKTKSNEKVDLINLTNNNGMTARITNLGATLVSLLVTPKNGKSVDVVLGFDNLDDYLVNHCYFGAIVGRNCNRIGNACFKINGKTYNLDKNERNKNNLHSGFNGYQKRIWDYSLEKETNSVSFKLHSPDMDQGFPGSFDITVTYSLTDNNELKISYDGISDKDTVANMTNHTYFNLNGHNSGTVLSHLVQINSKKFAEVDNESIPTGELIDVENTPLDFTNFRKISDGIDSEFEQIKLTKGYDHSFLINKAKEGLEKIANVKSDKTNISLEVFSDCPALQFYTGNYIDEVPQTGKGGYLYPNRSGLCLETGFLPNSINQDGFKSPLLKANTRYLSTTIYKFS